MNQRTANEAAASAIRCILLLCALLLTLGCAEEDDGDSCEDYQCNRPPAAFCTDDGRLATYDRDGTCQADGCAYPLQLTTCDEASTCEDGECVASQ